MKQYLVRIRQTKTFVSHTTVEIMADSDAEARMAARAIYANEVQFAADSVQSSLNPVTEYTIDNIKEQ